MVRVETERRKRLLAWTSSAARDLRYASAVFGWIVVAFTVLVTGVSVVASLLVFVVGVFVWIGFAYVMRWTTWVDRRLAGWQRKERLLVEYRRPPARPPARSRIAAAAEDGQLGPADVEGDELAPTRI